MIKKLINQDKGKRTYRVQFEDGEEIVSGLKDLAKQTLLSASELEGRGIMSHAELGSNNLDHNENKQKLQLQERADVLLLRGSIQINKKDSELSLQVILSKRDGEVVGGQLLRALADPRVEIELKEKKDV